jgi:very-short-patch-repair endonuclease
MQSRASDVGVGELAGRQYGVVDREQLLALGLSRDAIAHRLAVGRLHRLHSSVYAVGHPSLSDRGAWMAAVLAGGDGAVLSHRSAAALWEIAALPAGRVEVTTPRSTRSTARLHRHCADLEGDEVAIRHRIPVTGVSRTLLDLASVVSRRDFERAVREAEFRRLPDQPPLAELLARHPRRRGARIVRATLEHLGRLNSGTSRSHLEDRFLRFVTQTSLPMPETNVKLRVDGRPYEADCLWRDAGLIVELDGHQAHGTRSAFESDRERDRRLHVAGWTVVHVTHSQLNTPAELAADLHRLLSHESASARPMVA